LFANKRIKNPINWPQLGYLYNLATVSLITVQNFGLSGTIGRRHELEGGGSMHWKVGGGVNTVKTLQLEKSGGA